MLAVLKKIWMRGLLKKAHYEDRFKRMDLLYAVKDPWGMNSERERFRFEETSRVIAQRLGPVGSLLEIGSGEGHQTAYLAKVADEVVGIDVSEKAVSRAKKRFAKASYFVSDLFSYELPDQNNPFDLVVACETLYYIKDIPAAIERMSSLGRRCLVTYFQGEIKNLDPYFKKITSLMSETITFQGLSWKVVWWDNSL